MQLAKSHGLNRIAQLLEANLKNRWERTPLLCAIANFSTGYSASRSAPLSAAEKIKSVELLLEQGAQASINVADKAGVTPLLEAARQKNIELEVIRFLLQKGAASSVNVKGGQAFRTPLRCAVDKGNTELVKLLLEYGAAKSINEPDVYRFTPLESAALRGHKEIAWLLCTYREGTSASQ